MDTAAWQRRFTKITRWEFWPFAAVYGPIMPVLLWYMMRARSVFFFTATNPRIAYGGFEMESKWQVGLLVPAAYQPKSVFIKKASDALALQEAAAVIGYPLFAKPDMGGKGRGVVKVTNVNQLLEYHQKIPMDYLLQAAIDLPREFGIYYVRVAGEKTGRITGIVAKEMLQVTGDGEHTVGELLEKDYRLHVYLPTLMDTMPKTMCTVLANDETRVLVPYGNHARGATFYDVTGQVTPTLTKVIDGICQQIKGFDFGRIDLRCQSLESLAAGGPFSIIEVNGSGAEPTHMYDPKNSIIDAWREIIKHWRWMYKVAVANHRAGIPYCTFKEGIAMLRASKEHGKLMADFQFRE